MATSIDFSIASSEQVVQELGSRLERIRLGRNLTQAELAARAGINKRTIIRLEKGVSATLDTFVRVLTALGLSSHLEALLPEGEVRPIERVLHRGRERQRARARQVRPVSQGPFRWGDEGAKK